MKARDREVYRFVDEPMSVDYFCGLVFWWGTAIVALIVVLPGLFLGLAAWLTQDTSWVPIENIGVDQVQFPVVFVGALYYVSLVKYTAPTVWASVAVGIYFITAVRFRHWLT